MFSLYTNIPHTDGIDACREALDSRETCLPPTRDLCQLIQTIFDQEQLRIQWTALRADSGHSHGHPDGAIICRHLYGEAGKRTPGSTSPATPRLVAIH